MWSKTRNADVSLNKGAFDCCMFTFFETNVQINIQLNLDSSKSPGLYNPSSSHPNFEAPERGFLNVFIEI